MKCFCGEQAHTVLGSLQCVTASSVYLMQSLTRVLCDCIGNKLLRTGVRMHLYGRVFVDVGFQAMCALIYSLAQISHSMVSHSSNTFELSWPATLCRWNYG